LHIAISNGFLEIFETLLDANADIQTPVLVSSIPFNPKNLISKKDGRTSLHLAVASNCFRIVEILVKRGSPVEIPDKVQFELLCNIYL
jgi:ankyrin repeat protein